MNVIMTKKYTIADCAYILIVNIAFCFTKSHISNKELYYWLFFY